jgi:hypothetical protein
LLYHLPDVAQTNHVTPEDAIASEAFAPSALIASPEDGKIAAASEVGLITHTSRAPPVGILPVVAGSITLSEAVATVPKTVTPAPMISDVEAVCPPPARAVTPVFALKY